MLNWGREHAEMTPRIFGEIPGYPEGSVFSSRRELANAGLHRPLQAGISGGAHEGAESIVVSGGYEDDRDDGIVLKYTGEGGRDPETGEQISNQELNGRNAAMVFSRDHHLPVRVIRGTNTRSQIAPKTGYRYDGLYHVEECWQEAGKSGYQVWRFRLRKIDLSTAPWLSTSGLDSRTVTSARPVVPQVVPTAKQQAADPRPVAHQPIPPPPVLPKLNTGDQVRHPIFGAGEVVAVQVYAQDVMVTVNFGSLGSKKLMASQAHLELIP